MPRTTTIEVPLNRVEGDLEVRVTLEQGRVADAWSAGVMYRGIERILAGRGALDGLVITPRVCGICGTAHLLAAARALEAITGVQPPPNALRVRSLALCAEFVQSDVRHGVLSFLADFASPYYAGAPLHEEAARRYEPLKGDSVIEVVRETKRLLEIVAVFGGQWPHSSFIVPGGVTSNPTIGDVTQSCMILRRFQSWYERRILGCSVERWAEVQSPAALDAWLDERPEHRDSELGLFLRLARDADLDQIGQAHGAFLCFGLDSVDAEGETSWLAPPAFVEGETVHPFDPDHIREHIEHSWFCGNEGGVPPLESKAQPIATRSEGHKYSWCTAPRYRGRAAEMGPLAEGLAARDPLLTSLVRQQGASVLTRELARLTRPAWLLPTIEQWIRGIELGAPFYEPTPRPEDGEGLGLVEATRGGLGHWVRLSRGRIERYRILTPTGWNGAPRDSEGQRGPWEEALVGAPVPDEADPMVLGHIVRSFDACLVCAVHRLRPTNGASTLLRRV